MDSRQPAPPAFARRFLEWYCPAFLHESIEGDLLQQFEQDVGALGARRARLRFWWNVIRFFRPAIIFRNEFSLTIANTSMIANYFKTASRNILKRKLYSFINAFGLSIGIAFCILIYLFILDEKSFDQFHVNKNDIYRIEEKSYDAWSKDPNNRYRKSAWIQVPFGPTVKEELAEVKYATRYNPDYRAIFRHGDKVFTENVTCVDADFFRMFSFPLLKGSAERLFLSKNEIVLTPAIAEKYFGADDPVGKSIEIDLWGARSMVVAGIIAPAPANSSLHYEVLVPQENRPYYDRGMQNWGNFSTPTFVQLQPGTDPASFKRALDKFTDKYLSDELERWKREYATAIPDDVKMLEYEFTRLPDIHLKKEVGWEQVSDPQYSLILGGLSVLILIIACINYVSLALTTSASRRTEVGIRKAAGAQRGQLVFQFCTESMVLALVSMVLGVGLAAAFLPAFNEFTAKRIEYTAIGLVPMAAVALGLTFIVGLIAGGYPSFFLSRFRPAQVLKGSFTSKVQAGFAKPLVVLQFSLAAFLIISSVIMFRQMRYITTKDLGYNKEQILVLPTQSGQSDEANHVVQRFRNRAQLEPVITAVSGTSASFNRGYSQYAYEINGERKAAYVYAVDPYYIPMLGIQLMEGRNFDPAVPGDTTAIIVNEALVRDMKWTDPLNEHLNWREDSLSLGAKVIGVVKDYHFLSLEQPVEPMFLSMDKRNVGVFSEMLVKVSTDDLPAAVEKVRELWKELNPDKPFDYSFVDDDIARQYSTYLRWMKMMGFATAFAIVISCLGLFGLAGINAINRTKEIGIRKVLGAGLPDIFFLLNRQYFLLTIIAFALAAPVSWYLMKKWLDAFAFRVALGWELFAISMAAALAVALLTVSYHAIRAALLNPAETLKYE